MIKVLAKLNKDGKMYLALPVILKDPVVRKYLIDDGWTPSESYICNICQNSRGGCCSDAQSVGEHGIYDFKNKRVIRCDMFIERKDNPENIRKPLND